MYTTFAPCYFVFDVRVVVVFSLCNIIVYFCFTGNVEVLRGMGRRAFQYSKHILVESRIVIVDDGIGDVWGYVSAAVQSLSRSALNLVK